jgi:Phosphoesterase family
MAVIAWGTGGGSASRPAATWWADTPGAAATQSGFEIVESGLASGVIWCGNLDGAGARCASAVGGVSGALTFAVGPGTYPWNVSVEGSRYYDASPGYDGYVNTSSSTSVHVAFTHDASHYIQHVVVVYLENEPLGSVRAYGPYENYLAANYEAASSFYAACHETSPNYLALIAGVTNSCTMNSSGDKYPTHAWKNVTLADLLQNATNGWNGVTHTNFTWADYAENLPSDACTRPGAHPGNGSLYYGTFATRIVPFLWEADTVHNAAFCRYHVDSLEPNGPANYSAYGTGLSFNTSVAEGRMANLSFISPNLCDDGHNNCTGIWQDARCQNLPNCMGASTAAQLVGRQADRWLQQFLTPLINGTGPYGSGANRTNDLKEMQHTAFFVVYDESEGNNTTKYGGYPVAEPANNNSYFCQHTSGLNRTYAVCGGNIYEVTVVPNLSFWSASMAGYRFTAPDSFYGILATIEQLFGLNSGPHHGGVCGPTIPGLHNAGCLDTLWITHSTTANVYVPMTANSIESTPEFKFARNGY